MPLSYFNYIGCNRHRKRVNKLPNIDYEKLTKLDKPMFRCEVCNANITNVGPKFKLHLVVKDDTETCNLMLLGLVAQSIIGHSPEDLWDGSYAEIEDPEILPEPILRLIGKSFCFGVSVCADNTTNGSDTFMVLEVCSGDKFQSIETNSIATTDIGTSSSTMSSAGVLMLDSISSEDPKTPFSKRREEDADLLDHSSTTKKPCTKMIKQEMTKTA